MTTTSNGTHPQQVQQPAPTPQPQQQPAQPATIQRHATPAPLVPENLSDAWRLAEALARSTVIPSAYQGNPGNVLAAIMLAHELRITPMLAMRSVYFVNDRPALYAELKLALVMRDPDCEYIVCTYTDARKATFEAKRRGQPKPTTLTVTIEEIPQSLKKKDTWQGFPANMLRWRCGGWICDLMFPDKVLGLKTVEEMEDAITLQKTGEVYAPPRPEQQVQQQAPALVSTTVVERIPEAQKEPAPLAQQVAATAEEKKPEPAPKEGPKASVTPDLVEVLLADLALADSTAAIDNIAQRAKAVPKDHPGRGDIGAAINARRKALKG